MSAQAVLFDAPGPKARLRHRLLTILGLLLAVFGLVLVLRKMADAQQLQGFMWTAFLEPDAWVNYLLPGLWGTIRAAALAIVLAFGFGLIFGMGRLSTHVAIRAVSGAIVEFFRAVPVLIMMIFLAGVFSANNVFPNAYNPLAAVVVALTLYNGSVVAELVRSGVHSLPRGQAEAGLSIGLSPAQTLRSIELPQALTAMLPALIGQLVVALKDTALGYQITYLELLNWSKSLGSAYANTVPAYLFAALIFIVINYSLTAVAARVEQRMRRRGRTPITAAPGLVGAEAEADAAPVVVGRSTTG
ncbi:MAG: amino acid ABC transporter permease [Kineosporiaceae bacterium]|nr:amino acid ABC transporter permease [Kineosporiaceae bacterium]